MTASVVLQRMSVFSHTSWYKNLINPSVSLEVTINFRIPHKVSIHTDCFLLPQNNCKFGLRSKWSEAYLCINACPILSQVAKSKLFVQASNLRLVLFTFTAEGSGLWYTSIRIIRNPGENPSPFPIFHWMRHALRVYLDQGQWKLALYQL